MNTNFFCPFPKVVLKESHLERKRNRRRRIIGCSPVVLMVPMVISSHVWTVVVVSHSGNTIILGQDLWFTLLRVILTPF